MSNSDNDSDKFERMCNYLRREAVSAANWACTLSVLNVLVLPMGFGSPVMLTVSWFVGWQALQLGRRAGWLQKEFKLGTSYTATASIGKWLGGSTLMIATIIAGMQIVSVFIGTAV